MGKPSIQQRSTAAGISQDVALFVLLAGGLAIWVLSLLYIEPTRIDSYGLIGILPPSIFVAYAMIIVGFCLSLQSTILRPFVPPLFLIALVLFLHATPAIGYGTLRYSWAWKHIGVIDFIMRHGQVDPNATFLSAYHNWPGFFVFFASIANALKLDPIAIAELARFYPTFLNFGFLAVLPLVFRNFTSDPRLIWTAVAIFLLANWVGQDYFSPQGSAFFMYLSVLALLTGPLAKSESHGKLVANHLNLQTGFLVLVTLSLILAIIAVHQITPIFLLSALVALAVTRQLSFGYLLFAILAEVLWLLYFAHAFLAPEMADLVASFGRLDSETVGRLADTSLAVEGQRVVIFASRGLSGIVAVGALLGGILRLSTSHFDLKAAILTLAPLPVLVATPYGGEIVFRLYLFCVPFFAFFFAAVFFPSSKSSTGTVRLLLVGALLLAMVPGFILANNGKDEQYYFTHLEVEAADWLYSNSTAGQLLIEGNRSYPSQFRNYENFIYLPLSEELPEITENLLTDPSKLLVRWLRQTPAGGFIVLTRSQKAEFENLGSLPRGEISRIEQKLMASPHLKIVFSNDDATIFSLSGTSLER